MLISTGGILPLRQVKYRNTIFHFREVQSSFAHWFQLVYIKRRVLLRVMSIQGITFFIRLIIVRPTGSLSSLLFQVHAGISTTVSILFLQCTQLYHGTALLMRREIL